LLGFDFLKLSTKEKKTIKIRKRKRKEKHLKERRFRFLKKSIITTTKINTNLSRHWKMELERSVDNIMAISHNEDNTDEVSN